MKRIKKFYIPEWAQDWLDILVPALQIALIFLIAAVLLAGIDAGNQDRAKLLDWVKNYDADGLSKHYKWNDKGERQAPTVYGYKVENSKIVPIGAIGE